MAVPFRPVAVKLPPRATHRSREIRKIALLGGHSASIEHCPWNDPSWELWGHTSARTWYHVELDRYFDLHPRSCWLRKGKSIRKYTDWLASNTVPIYMQEKYSEVPASRRYPKERILMEYGGARQYFKNHLAWMIALAFSEGVTTIGLFGINYSHNSEYQTQRGSAEYWLGRAEERGVHVILPDKCTLLAEPAGLYGYESHDENGKRLPQWAYREPELTETIRPLVPGQPARAPSEPPTHLLEEIAAEEAMRPEWARGSDQPAWLGRTNGGIQRG